MGHYYVVTLEHSNPLAEKSKFHYLGRDLVGKSIERLRAKMLRTGRRTAPDDIKYAEIYTFGEVAPGYEHLIPEWMLFHMPTEEYGNFAKVYFLNEVAYRMYSEGGVEFEIAKIISENELPKGCSRNFRGPYIPEE